MKLLLVSSSVVPVGLKKYGGIEHVIAVLAGGLARAGHDVTLAAPYGSIVPDGVKLFETVHLPEEQDMDENADKIYDDMVTERFYYTDIIAVKSSA